MRIILSITLPLLLAACHSKSDEHETCIPCLDSNLKDGVYNNVHFDDAMADKPDVSRMEVKGDKIIMKYRSANGVERTAVFRIKTQGT